MFLASQAGRRQFEPGRPLHNNETRNPKAKRSGIR